MKKIFLTLLTTFTILFLLFFGIVLYKNIVFDINCSDRIKRAADANTVELAIKEMIAVVDYLDNQKLTTGYTSILYQTPDEDIEFWYQNLNESLKELVKLPKETTPLERSNMLIKLRETLIDQGKENPRVTKPAGISLYPNNLLFALWGWISFLFTCIFGILYFISDDF